MSSYVFVVLLPNARRQTISATQDTTLLQILEDACKKHGLNPLEWSLMHFNRNIELGNVVRFSGLPNNATLEMVPCTKQRVESPVTVGLQLESGKRLTHQFSPQENIWNIFQHWNEKGELQFPNNENLTLACIYMRQEISGEAKLREKTLKSLGILQGSAVLRVVTRKLNEEVRQANVSSVLKRPSTNADVGNRADDQDKLVKMSQLPSAPVQTTLKSRSPSPSPMDYSSPSSIKDDLDSHKSSPDPNLDSIKAGSSSQRENAHLPRESKPRDLSPEPLYVPKELHVPRGTLQSVDIEGAYVYHADDVIVRGTSNYSDDFFEVTIEDVKSIYRNLQTKRRELEETPLQLRSVREEEHEKWLQSCLASHPTTAVRIRFPDRLVLQGTFKSDDSFSVIYNFVRQCLEKNDLDFYLFVTPPKKILAEASRLIDEGMVGLAIMYFGSASPGNHYLKKSLPLSDPNEVFKISTEAMQQGGIPKENITFSQVSQDPRQTGTRDTPGPSQLKPDSSNLPKPTSKTHPRPENSNVVPKWFKK